MPSSISNKLQWGRDVSVAEINIRGFYRFNRNMLQWGRDVSVAEISSAWVPKLCESWLQWGRDVSVAEIVPKPEGRA